MAKDILQLVIEKEEQACRDIRRGVIICPGAVGDCLLTLPLAEFIKKSLGLGGIDFIGHTEYIDFYPGRSCIDSVRSVDSIEFNRLFAEQGDFAVEDGDRLISSFSSYECIVSFLGTDDANFESNLIYTVSCSHPAEVTMLPMKGEFDGHISEFYIRKFIEENGLDGDGFVFDSAVTQLKAHPSDIANGKRLLVEAGVDPDEKLLIIHPGSGGAGKCWHLDNYLHLAERIRVLGVQVVFLAGPAELDRYDDSIMERIKSAGILISGRELTEVMQLFTWCDCYAGNDSGISHLAGTLGLPTVAVFGPTKPDMYKPVGGRVNVIKAGSGSFSAASDEELNRVFEIVSGILQD